jgi:hypothetical protein
MSEFIIYTIIITLILAGVGYWLQFGMKAEIELRRRARDWPKTMGTVTSSQVEQKKRWLISFGAGSLLRVQPLHRYKPVVNYTYQVAGKSYQSSKYKNGLIYRSGEWMSLIPKVVEKIIAEHPQGKTVTVIYNPEDPSQAYLALDSSISTQVVYRIGSFLLFAAAACLLVVGAVRVGESLAKQKTARNIPAAIPAKTEDIKKGLARDLGMTCQSEKSGVGHEMVYTLWDCGTPPSDGLTRSFVMIYNRELAPETVDSIHTLTGETDPQKEVDYFVTVTALAVPSIDIQMVEDWMVKMHPTLTEMGSKAEMAVNGVKLALSNPNGMGVWLDIGEIK